VERLGIAYFGYGLLIEWGLMLVAGIFIIRLLDRR